MQTHAPENSLITFVNVIYIYVRARREFEIFLLSLHNFCFVSGAKKMGFLSAFLLLLLFFMNVFFERKEKRAKEKQFLRFPEGIYLHMVDFSIALMVNLIQVYYTSTS